MTQAHRPALRKLWFSANALTPYQGPEPAFYPREELPWLDVLEQAFDDAREELELYLSQQQVSSPYFSKLVGAQGWSTLPLRTWGVNYYQQQQHFPRTMSRLAAIDHLVSVSINRLAPGASIAAHFGDTNAAVRAHLGLIVPAQPPESGLLVNGEVRGWQQGKALAFCDGYLHSAWNHADSDRYILLVDVIRPEFQKHASMVCRSVLASLFLQRIMQASGMVKVLLFLPLRLALAGARLAAGPATVVHNWLSARKARKQ